MGTFPPAAVGGTLIAHEPEQLVAASLVGT